MIGIYKIENMLNHHVYIGQSTNIKERWQEHQRNGIAGEDANNKVWYNYPIYRAIRKYGLDNFEFTVLEETSLEQLNERERYWINYYDSYNNGYNATTGGDGHSQVTELQKEQIIQMWNKLYLMNDISTQLQIDKHTIISILKQYEPSYSVEEARRRGSIASGKAHYKSIDCYDIYNHYLRTYNSISEAAKHLNIREIGIIKCCKHQSPYYMNYRFAYHKELLWEIPLDKHLTSRPIYKIDSSGNKTYYLSYQDAVRQDNISEYSIRKSIKNNQPASYDTSIQWYLMDYSHSPIITNYIYYTTEDGYVEEKFK